jgi:putative hydrolase of the HAD superfamily
MIKAIFFDAAGTLIHLPRGVGWHYQDVAARFGCALNRESLDQSFGSVWKSMPARPATHWPRPDDDRAWWRELVERVLNQCEVTPPQLPRPSYFEELYHEFTQPGVWALYPEVREVLTSLRGRFRLGIISNFDGRLRPILANLGIADDFADIIISSETGAEKPDTWIFQQALGTARIAPSEALHVGDDPVRDWQGAAAAGLHVFHLERPVNSLRDLAARFTAPSAF